MGYKSLLEWAQIRVPFWEIRIYLDLAKRDSGYGPTLKKLRSSKKRLNLEQIQVRIPFRRWEYFRVCPDPDHFYVYTYPDPF